ncbi:chemotaxis protein CheW [Massilia sp. CF038]|uniref:chemotaxis protein CheW n=1 Tax=Massilia sp. CF038 TaxID=1881045 RepID=UPI0009228316|nr:chemotaxis protein CheW [Massilia sp. CF038]SHH39289.1 purine-binding chemotaxis protein CheW [Massilia sp. CF038]
MQVSEEQLKSVAAVVPPATKMVAARALELARVSSATLELFGSFHLGGQEFALAASCIREVVNFPDKMIPVPLAPAFLEGVFTLRGQVIPVLNLARIFDAAAPAAERTHKIAIVDHGEVQVGVLFHDTGEVLRVRPEQRSMLQYRDERIRKVVSGTISLDDGARLLQILDPSALADIENVPHVQMLRNIGRHAEGRQFERRAQRRQCVSFSVGGTAFAFEMCAIREIIMVPELMPSVMTSPLCLGRINFRGHAVAVVDFAALLHFGAHQPAAAPERRILVALVGETLIGFMVDSVDSIFHFEVGEVLPIPLLSKARAAMFIGCVSRAEGDDILFLNHEGIFSQTELVEIGTGHVRLYQAEAEAAGGGQRVRSARNRGVYVVFGMDSPWAVEIGQLREIISWRPGMVKPPGLPPCVHGVLNLRHQMISVVNLRCLYGMGPAADPQASKILIVERGDECYGLLVDSVDNLLTVSGDERRPCPRMLAGEGALAHVREVIDVTGPDGSPAVLNVFDPEDLFASLERAMQ